MIAIRPYLPLFGFLLPTVVVGYGVVIPRSCIAGVNELTVGFASTLFGAALTYVAGQRAVLPKTVCTRPPLRVRLLRALNRQAAAPSGVVGRVLGFVWPLEHARLHAEVVDALALEAGMRVLDVGCGTGHMLKSILARIGDGHAVGVDVSPLMIERAAASNRRAVAAGALSLRAEDVARSAFEGASFHRIVSVNSIYFWSAVEPVLAALAAALRPGGCLVLVFRPDGPDVPTRFRDPTYRFPETREVAAILERHGLHVDAPRPTCAPGIVLVCAHRPATS